MAQTASSPAAPHELERNSYNAAFYALGLRWHWDHETYQQLMHRSDCPAERLRHYLETRQPHLLKAYDAAFLSEAIQQRRSAYRCSGRPGPAFDWGPVMAAEIGA
jgi:hypothetical protein